MLKVKVFTIFPEAFPGTLGISIPFKALKEKKWELKVVNIRDFAEDKHKQVDEYPYGGGSGMLMKADVLGKAIESELAGEPVKPLILITSARGRTFNQKMANDFSKLEAIYIVCGRFEGIDERFIEYYNALEVNLGHFVLFGGETAAITMLEAVVRLLPEVLSEANLEESYATGTEFENLMEYPQYTHPREWNGMEVPEVLLSGNHAKIKKWRLEKAKEITLKYLTSVK